MPDTNLPALDKTSSHWLTEVQQATMSSKTCSVPKKYFDVLFAWGYVEGCETAARLSDAGMSQFVSEQAATKSNK